MRPVKRCCRGYVRGRFRGSSARGWLGETNMKDDEEDYPVSYLLYVSGTLVAIGLVAMVAYVFLL